ncbi:MAG TPA: hypothetical protein VJV03_16105 [Pyrinomonadaceae bacterium]|nr:hypothetical protein [Pyrinomonadaceae bacterium]
MDKDLHINELKSLLRHEVAMLCQHDSRKWKSEISKTVKEIRANNWSGVFFGGMLRSLLVSRLATNSFGRPRDVDIVLSGIKLQDIKVQFERYISRETRFGGVQLCRKNSQFDLWPLESTFAFQGKTQAQFPDLPKTTFLNLEAVAIDVWPQMGKPRTIYSGDEQFFKGILSRTIELNNEINPFPELSVARALVIASDLQWKVGVRLVKYIVKHGVTISEIDFEDVQRRHYGGIKLRGEVLPRVLEYIVKNLDYSIDRPFELPLPKQLRLWSEDSHSPRLSFTVIKAKSNHHG